MTPVWCIRSPLHLYSIGEENTGARALCKFSSVYVLSAGGALTRTRCFATVRGDSTWIFLVRTTSHEHTGGSFGAPTRPLRPRRALFSWRRRRGLCNVPTRVCARAPVHQEHTAESRRSISRRTQVFMAVRAMRMQQLHRSPSVGPGCKRASASAHERGRSTGAARAHKLALCQLVPRLTHCGAPPYPSCCCSSPCCLCRQREARWPLIGARR